MHKYPKVVTVGSVSTGKSCLIGRYLFGDFKFFGATVGCFPSLVKANSRGLPPVTFELVDTAGSERFDALTPSYLRGASIVLLVYDICDAVSFRDAQHRWLDLIRTTTPDAQVILVGTKLDLAKNMRQVPTERAARFASDAGFMFYETSAVTGDNVNHLFKATVNILSRAGRHMELSDSLVLDRVRRPDSGLEGVPTKRCLPC